MKRINLGSSDLMVSVVGLGCMRMYDKDVAQTKAIIQAALDSGINFFDHADIYGAGHSETIFGQALKEMDIKREDIIIQSKCGIRGDLGMFDFSKQHILKAVDGILERLQTTYIDILLLHRPDTLVNPEEVNEAFEELFKAGKVRHFGVSNQSPGQMDLLKTKVKYPLLANQLQFSLMHTGMIDQGLNVNMKNDHSIDHDNGILDYCRINNVTIQAWSPFQFGTFAGTFLDYDKFPELNECLNKYAAIHNVSNTVMAIAWILHHPANMQAIIGSMNPERIREIGKASDVVMTNQEWYELYRSAGNLLP